MHGQHCYDADGLLICGWPDQHILAPAGEMGDGLLYAGSVGGWLAAQFASEQDPTDDPADSRRTVTELHAYGFVR